MVLEQGEEIQLVHTSDGRLAAPGDVALVAVALVGALSAGAWTGALVLILTHPAHGIGVGMAAVAATLTLVALNLGLDVARRRRLREAITDIRAEIHAVAGSAHAETVESLATLAREVEHLSAKLVTDPTLDEGAEADEARRLQASQVFEMGRRVGQRQAARVNGFEAGSAGS